MKVELEKITLSYGSGIPALSNVNLSLKPGERLAVLGPSGSGKTSLLRIIAGLERPSSGQIRLDGRDALPIPPHHRGVAMAFQNPALYPHKSVRANLEFGLGSRKVGRSTETPPLKEIAARLGIDDLLDRWPDSLSGGQKARVALGRALMQGRSVLLLDEPFSGLDAPLRRDLGAALLDWQRTQGFSLIFVTHDQEEATTIGERVVIFDQGKILQEGHPQMLFEDPDSLLVASLLGRTQPTRIVGILKPRQDIDEFSPLVDPQNPLEFPSGRRARTEQIVVALVRPGAVRVVSHTAQEFETRAIRLKGRVERSEGVGSESLQVVATGLGQFRVAPPLEGPLTEGSDILIELNPARILWFDRVFGTRIRGE